MPVLEEREVGVLQFVPPRRQVETVRQVPTRREIRDRVERLLSRVNMFAAKHASAHEAMQNKNTGEGI